MDAQLLPHRLVRLVSLMPGIRACSACIGASVLSVVAACSGNDSSTANTGGRAAGQAPSGGASTAGGVTKLIGGATSIGSTVGQVGGATSVGGTVGSVGGTTSVGGTSASVSGTPKALWSMGYYASWKADQYPISEIEWSGMTHVALAFYTPKSDGSLSLTGGNAALASDLVHAAHQNGRKAIASLGGADSAAAFRQATSSATMPAFVNNLVALMQDVGFDGLDVDWEPLAKSEESIAIDLANRLRAKAPDALITIPVGCLNVNLDTDLTNYASIASVYDQINLMSYGLSGAWEGWKSWHSSPLYHQDSATPMSIDSSIKLYLAAGVPKQKLGIGIGFYGLCYSPPVTAPDQALNGATLVASDGAISYANIMLNYYSAAARKWDSEAKVPYLSFAAAQPPDGCGYISYDDEQSVAEKAAYVKSLGLGGVIEWEINEGYVASAPSGQKSPLLTAIGTQLLR